MSNYIFGKVKRKQNPFRIISTDVNVYDTVQQPLNGIEYNPNTLIEEEEFYQLSSFLNSGYSINFLSTDFNSVDFDQISKDDLKKLSFIFTIQNDLFFFQIINPSYFISKKWFSIDELTLETEKPIITINSVADVIYDRVNDVLYFKRLSVANRIFKGMDQLYREATDQETEAFLNNNFLSIDEDFAKEKVSIPNRKRIALITETLDRFSSEEKQGIYEYTSQYGHVTYADGKFKIDTDEDLKFVLWGIEQRFYTTPIGGEKRVANSIISLND